jgi:hypothetical protein
MLHPSVDARGGADRGEVTARPSTPLPDVVTFALQ